MAASTGRFYGRAMTAGGIYTVAGSDLRNQFFCSLCRLGSERSL
jgi:hypothetical protein